jgi:hypothetical protein
LPGSLDDSRAHRGLFLLQTGYPRPRESRDAVLLMALTFETFEKHATAAGIVRAPALLFMMLALTGLWSITRTQKTSLWTLSFTGLAAALTAMSH